MLRMTINTKQREVRVTTRSRKSGGHRWSFFRAGGFDQVKLETGADLMALGQLDQKLWVALGCPTSGLEFDADTLKLIDTDQDGRIRAPDIIAALQWAGECLKDPDILMHPASALPLAAIDDSRPEGQRVLASAKRILASLGKPNAETISTEDTSDTTKVFAQTNFNGDGVLPADAADEPVKSVIVDIIACLGAQKDRSGKDGVTQEMATQFFADCRAYIDWWQQAATQPEVLPLGEATATAAAALDTVRAKVDDYFARCRLAAFDERAAAALNREEKDYLALAAKDLTITAEEISALPLARVAAGRPLPLTTRVNPAWADALEVFRVQVVTPLLGMRDALTDEEWMTLTAKFEAYRTWAKRKPSVAVEKLGLDRLRAILADDNEAALAALIAKDKALESEFDAIVSVDRLVRYHRDLLSLLNNFVSFRHFYRREGKAIFQAGTLFIDQRSCDLCIRVGDVAKHVTTAHLSRSYLLYCDCVRRATGEKMTIVAAVTDGEPDNLNVGRNGIFYDRQGRDWDATVTKIVENPISIREAFWAPYKRLMRWIGDQVAKRAAAADTASTQKLQTATADVAKPAEPGKAPGKMFDVGVVAALGVAVGGITAALGALLQAFFGLGIWMPIGFVGLLFMISGPSMLIAWLKLRHRNLGPLLDANGWAVNAEAKLNIPFGKALTGMPSLPPGSKRDMTDMFAEKHGKRTFVIVLLIVLILLGAAWYFGFLDVALPSWLDRATMLSTPVPPLAPPPAPAAPPAP